MLIRVILFFVMMLSISSYAVSQNYKAIVGATVINTNGAEPQPNSIILIKDSLIVAVGQKIKGKIPEDAQIINANGKYVIPGLIDGHIHFFQSGGLYTRPDGLDLRHRVPYSQEIKQIRNNMDDLFRRYISCGITSVIDVGGPMWNFDVRQQSRSAEIAPRVFLCGPLIASYQPKALETEDMPIIKVTNKEQALELVHKQLEKKPDFIKIWYVVGRPGSAELEEFYPIVKAIIDESHRNNLPVIVHATELETARKAVEAGCDVLAHCITDKEVDKDLLQLCKKNNVIIVPTLWVFESYSAVYSKQLKLTKEEHFLGNPKVIGTLFDMYELAYSELGERQKKLLVEKKPIETSPILLKNIKLMNDFGITLGAGTDAGNVGVIHGPSLYRELTYMSRAGMTNQEILQAATLNNAKIFRKDNLLGSIEQGKLADLLILNSDPLDDIKNVSDIDFVIKNGKVIDPKKIIEKTPEDLAQIQLNAYNERNLEAFLEVYSEDIEIYSFPDSLVSKGKDTMRKLYAEFFSNNLELHCKLVNRIINGKYVIDREQITGNQRKEFIEASAIYEIENGLIKKVWFLQ